MTGETKKKKYGYDHRQRSVYLGVFGVVRHLLNLLNGKVHLAEQTPGRSGIAGRLSLYDHMIMCSLFCL